MWRIQALVQVICADVEDTSNMCMCGGYKQYVQMWRIQVICADIEISV
jgi:hypothetical protein